MKKTLQRELKASDPGGGEVTSNNHSVTNSRSIVQPTDEDVNFKYLKHVLIKFLTCREYEVMIVCTFMSFVIYDKPHVNIMSSNLDYINTRNTEFNIV